MRFYTLFFLLVVFLTSCRSAEYKRFNALASSRIQAGERGCDSLVATLPDGAHLTSTVSLACNGAFCTNFHIDKKTPRLPVSYTYHYAFVSDTILDYRLKLYGDEFGRCSVRPEDSLSIHRELKAYARYRADTLLRQQLDRTAVAYFGHDRYRVSVKRMRIRNPERKRLANGNPDPHYGYRMFYQYVEKDAVHDAHMQSYTSRGIVVDPTDFKVAREINKVVNYVY